MTLLKVHPNCLMFFLDETGHEEFADSNYPIFGIGGCSIPYFALDEIIRQPWQKIKEKHFGNSKYKLHAADMDVKNVDLVKDIADFFEKQKFGRFAATMSAVTNFPGDYIAYNFMPSAIRKRCEELASRMIPTPEEIAFLHESSERGDVLVERYFGPYIATIEGRDIKVHQGFLDKSVGDEAMEVADFIVHAAGNQALRGRGSFRKDFKSIFQTNMLWSSFIHIEDIKEKTPS